MRPTRIAIFPRLAGAAALAALVAGALSTATFAADKPVADCPPETLVQPFLNWHDHSSYFLAPGGDFETAPAGWTLTGSPAVVAGNESFHVNAPGDRFFAATVAARFFCQDNEILAGVWRYKYDVTTARRRPCRRLAGVAVQKSAAFLRRVQHADF